jgi:hypothetical protein
MTDFLEQIVKNGQAYLDSIGQSEILQPDSNGEFRSAVDGAVWMAAVHGFRQTPLQGKVAFLTNWQQSATTDLTQIRNWAYQHPGCNFGSVADEHEIFEVDSLEVRKRFNGNFSNTLTVASSEGKGHRYYLPADVEHIAQNATKHGDFSLRKHNAYCVSPGSVHPTTGLQYRVVINVPMLKPTQDEIAFWRSERVEKDSASASQDEPIPSGKRNSTITSILGKARQVMAMDSEQLFQYGLSVNQQRCQPPLPDSEIRTIANSVARYNVKQIGQLVFPEDAVEEPVELSLTDESEIPVFDDSVITGIYRDTVDLVTNGTTIPRQFAFLAAKVFIGARMAGKITFQGLEADSSYYGAVIGTTGTSKGEAWRRTVEKVLNMPELTVLKPVVKIIYSADSGAGLRDAFFEPPQDLPMICYVDEATSLGHKAGEKKNPEILDHFVELADSHRISRVKAKHGKEKSARTHENARLSIYMCGQDGSTFMSAFAGRTKLGMFDRLYPEFTGPIEAGLLNPINESDIVALHAKINKLDFSGEMTMTDKVDMALEAFWMNQPPEIRRKIRLKKHLMLDMYMAAFGRGVRQAELEDLEVAQKIFKRQLVIRRVCFTGEVPDRVGFYTGKLKAIVDAMRKQLNHGKTWRQVARSIRDIQTMTNAFRDNELHVFERAWKSMSDHFKQVMVPAGNGQKYPKWVPMPFENEYWLPPGA